MKDKNIAKLNSLPIDKVISAALRQAATKCMLVVRCFDDLDCEGAFLACVEWADLPKCGVQEIVFAPHSDKLCIHATFESFGSKHKLKAFVTLLLPTDVQVARALGGMLVTTRLVPKLVTCLKRADASLSRQYARIRDQCNVFPAVIRPQGRHTYYNLRGSGLRCISCDQDYALQLVLHTPRTGRPSNPQLRCSACDAVVPLDTWAILDMVLRALRSIQTRKRSTAAVLDEFNQAIYDADIEYTLGS